MLVDSFGLRFIFLRTWLLQDGVVGPNAELVAAVMAAFGPVAGVAVHPVDDTGLVFSAHVLFSSKAAVVAALSALDGGKLVAPLASGRLS